MPSGSNIIIKFGSIVVNPDYYSVGVDGTLTVPAGFGLLENDGTDFGTVQATAFTDPADGSLSLQADGSFTYTPNSGFAGQDTFTYYASNGFFTGSATVTLDVYAPHVVAEPDTYEAFAGQSLTVGAANGLLANDTTTSGSVQAFAFSTPAHGALDLSADGHFTYTPNAGFVGDDTFTYYVESGGTTASAVDTIDVVYPGGTLVANSDTYVDRADATLTIDAAHGLLSNDASFAGTVNAFAFSTPAHGALDLSADGHFSYTPDAGFVGTDTFTYYVSDGLQTATAVDTIDVVDQTPIAAPDYYHVGEDGTLTVAAAQGLLSNDISPDGNTVQAFAFSTPAHGTLDLSADGHFTYTPDAGFIGNDTFTYYISDGSVTNSTVDTIEVGRAGLVADPIVYNVMAGSSLTEAAASGLLAHSYYSGLLIFGGGISAEAFSTPPNGTADVSADGSFTYTPNSGFSGSDSFTYYIANRFTTASSTATFDVYKPTLIAAPDVYVVDEGKVLTVGASNGLIANDFSAAGTVAAEAFSTPAHGTIDLSADGHFTYTPNAGFTGSDTFTYYITNGISTASAVDTFDVISDPVVANSDAYSTRAGTVLTVDAAHGLLNNDFSVGGTVTAEAFSTPAHGALDLSADGHFTYTPNAGFVGTDTFTYYITNGAATASAVDTIDVSDRAPVANPDFYNFIGTSDVVDATHGLLVNDFDPDGDPITAIAYSTPAHGTLDLSADGHFTYTPNAGYSGSDTATYYISDGSLTSSAVATFDDQYPSTVCYVAGTRVLTDRGEVAVEHLTSTDKVITAAGAHRPIRWLGHRRVDCSRHPRPPEVWPIRIQAGAFSEGLPSRNLWVSPGHSIFVDGVLIQAESLLNSATVTQVPMASVEYWHVELDSHDIILAEGLAAESYLDTGNRAAFFNNGGAYLEAHPNFKPVHWSDTCVPLVMEGPILQNARVGLLERARTLGYCLTSDSDAHILAAGERIEPVYFCNKQRMAFAIPAGRKGIELRCQGFTPSHIGADSRDHRRLGLCVGRLQIDGVNLPLDDDAVFERGWHLFEADVHSPKLRQRWSSESVPLTDGTRLVVIELVGRSFCWAPSEADSASMQRRGEGQATA